MFNIKKINPLDDSMLEEIGFSWHTDEDGSNPFYVWGQDRMWLLKEEINKRLG